MRFSYGSHVGIRWKMFAFMMLFLFILLGLLWCIQVVFFGRIYKSVKTSEIIHAAQILTSNCDLDDKQMSLLSEKLAKDYDVCVFVLEMSGNTGRKVVSLHYRSDCVIHKMDDLNIGWLYYYAKHNGGERLTQFPQNEYRNDAYYSGSYVGKASQNSGEAIIYTKIANSTERGRDLLIILNTSISPVGSTVSTLRTELIIVSVVMTAAALLLSFLLARNVSRPIIRINSGAKLLAEGNYDVRFRVGGYREIAELSDTLSIAAEELSKTGALEKRAWF